MAIIGKTFDAQLVSAGDDGALYRMLAGRKDALTPFAGGNPFTISNNVLSIAQSYLLLCGRFMRIGGGTTISLGTIPSNHVKGRVIVTLDMTKLASESTLSQIITEVETIASSGSYRSLTTNDINSINSSGKYEAVLCTFTCSSGTASSPVSALSTALTYPLAIANGGTGATTSAQALTNIGALPLLSYTSSDSWVSDNPNLTHIENIYAYAGKNAIVECNYTGSNYKFIAVIDWGNANYGGMLILSQRAGVNVQTFRKGMSWYQTGVPRIMRWTYAPEVTTASSYANYKTTGVTTLSGQAFSSTGADAWNVYVAEAGLYRVDLKLTAPTGSGYISVFTGHDATPNYSGACQLMPLSSAVGRLSCSEVMEFTANQPVSFIVRCSSTTDELAGWMTLEKLS